MTPEADGLFGPQVAPMSMAQALEWDNSHAERTLRSNYGTGGNPQARGERISDGPASTVTGRAGRNKWIMSNSPLTNAASHDANDPAGTIFGQRSGNMTWMLAPAGATSEMVDPRNADDPSGTITGKGTAAWVMKRNSGPGAEREPREASAPSYTVRANGSGSHPSGVEWVLRNGNQAHNAQRELDDPAATTHYGARSNKVEWVIRQERGSGMVERYGSRPDRDPNLNPSPTITAESAGSGPRFRKIDENGECVGRVSVREAGILQSFPADYPWCGTKSQQYQQVGNAVPVRLAEAVLRALIA